MKRIAFIGCAIISASVSHGQQPAVVDSVYQLSSVEVKAIRASDRAPFAKSNLSKKEVGKLNNGQDIPFLLNQTPSVVVNSDAGTGIGYTGIRIRGTDATRVNITLNGIPFNDAESHGSFFVNLPDFSSSVNSIQVQRGVGTSTNGTGAFGATVSLSTNEINRESYAEINNSFGSFNTWKHTIKAGTGLIDDHFTVDARLSQISSDGFIDRATSRLQAFYLSGAYLGEKNSLRFNIFSGKEKTFQAWNGVPEAKLRDDKDALLNHYYNNLGSIYHTSADSANLFGADKRRYNLPLYDNETDNYTQTHYQLFYDQQLGNAWNLNVGTFLTRGAGYYENYRYGEDFEDYGLPNISVNGELLESTDLIRRKALDNHFYGQIFSLQKTKEKNTFTFGGGWTVYDGDHIGTIIWSRYGFDKDQRYYDNPALKTDINAYAKWEHQLTERWSLFGDMQYRRVSHRMEGFEDNPSLLIDRDFNFLNPKAGVSYNHDGWGAYASYAMANKEPNRDDFEAGATNQPKHETLHDFEAGIEKRTSKLFASASLYYMRYDNQLVLTGQVNDVGAYTRINVPQSYRAGIELQAGYIISPKLNVAGNIAFSRNKIKSFTYFLDEYDADFEWIGQFSREYRNSDIAFAPSVVGGATINVLPVKDLEISAIAKYVGRQYLDNTQDAAKQLNAFYTQDVRGIYTLRNKVFKEWSIMAQVNNIFNRSYEPNGYTWGYVYDGTVVNENFYFPMAGVNFMVGVNVRL